MSGSIVFKPYEYQKKVIEWTVKRYESALLLDMGMGKTVMTLTVLKEWLETLESFKVLIIAPKRVAESVWAQEIEKWEHLHHLSASCVVGTPKQRTAALEKDADLYIIGVDNLKWLDVWDFDTIVVDELSLFRNLSSQRYKALARHRKAVRRFIGLTGTFAPKSLIDAYPQMLMVDRGKSLGTSKARYTLEYFVPDKVDRATGRVFTYAPKEGATEKIAERISQSAISLNADDLLSLPPVRVYDIVVDIPKGAYRTLERDKVLDDTIVGNPGVLVAKLQQIAQGFMYGDEVVHEYHSAKLDALSELVESQQGKPLLVIYNFEHDRDLILSKFKQARLLKGQSDIDEWNKGNIGMLLIHPRSAGHGLNLQQGGSDMVWYGLTYDLEMYQQVNKRLHRPGQTNHVNIYRILAKGTVDDKVIVPMLENKATLQSALTNFLNLDVD